MDGVALVELTTTLIYPFYSAHIALLTSEKTRIHTEYSDFSNIFSSNSAAELREHTRINNHLINLLNDKQPSYSLIYSLEPIELEIFKTYIELNLVGSFNRLSKSSNSTLILFVQKKDISFHLCIDYQGLNNLTIKNR